MTTETNTMPRCECGKPATWCHEDDMNADGTPMDGMGMCDDRREALVADGVDPSELKRL